MARRRKGEAVSGWINLDKPRGLGSTPAVSRVRRAFNAQKAGHAGTLDPLADGVLPIALGEATKTVAFLMEAEKAYRFTLRWGAETTTLDEEGEIVARSDVRPSSREIAAALADLIGDLEQVPPAYSAIRVGGARAYDLAREGHAVELAPRLVTLRAARLLSTSGPELAEIEIECSKGFYVRALVRDLAAALCARAHVASLRRTRVGPFTETTAMALASVEEVCHRGAPLEALLPVETALDDIPELAVTVEDAFRLTQGRSIVLLPRHAESLRAGPSRIVSARHGGRLVALCEMRAGRLNPTRVFNLT